LGAGVADFFPMLFRDGGDGFVLQVDEFSDQFQRLLWACFHAFLASAAFVRVNDDEVFA
jgi:hypothetical protein